MAITKTTTTSIKDASVEEANINNCAATNTKLGADAVTSAKINNGTVTTDDLASTLDLSSKTITLPSDAVSFDREYNNIGLLGFKMAVNESLTVFNLVDGVVDEFNDESGTDEAEGSNDTYCGTDDFYSNSLSGCISAGFSLTAITEPDTSTAGTNPAFGSGTPAQFSFNTPANLTIHAWGSGGSAGYNTPGDGGGGGFAKGTFSYTGCQTLYIVSGEGGGNWSSGQKNTNAFGGDHPDDSVEATGNRGGGGKGEHGGGGGLAFIGTNVVDQENGPDIIIVGGAGGGGGGNGGPGGAGGGLTGQDASGPAAGEGGSQSAGGTAGPSVPSGDTTPGGFLYGGNSKAPQNGGGGGAGYYGGGGGGIASPILSSPHGSGGGGSSYIGHPQISCGSTEGGNNIEGGGTADPNYVAGTNEGGVVTGAGNGLNGEDGYVLITGSYSVAQNTTIVSSTFSATSVPTSSRIVVFEENIDTPTLNTDIIASVSRDGTNFTTATLSDSGYVTGSSGQRILTGQADISGQPSGQSMRWKLQLANNQVKIHGVSLSWA